MSTTPAGARTLQVFVREGCPHCADAKAFLADWAQQRPGLQILLRPVDTDAQARQDLSALSREAGVWPPGVPTFVVDGRVLVGFDDAEHAGRALQALVDGPQRGMASPDTASPVGCAIVMVVVHPDSVHHGVRIIHVRILVTQFLDASLYRIPLRIRVDSL